jgi:hypothetical protein
MPRIRLLLFVSLLTVLSSATPALSGVTLEMREVGGDVVVTGAGKLNVGAWTLVSEDVSLEGTVNGDESIAVGPNALSDLYGTPVNFSGPTSIGPGLSAIVADAGSGHTFGLAFGVPALVARVNALSDPTYNGSSTWLGETLGSLGVTPGSYRWTWGSGATADSFTLHARGGACVDGDDDGYGAVGHVDCPGGLLTDCDDTDPLIHPNAADVCDTVDNNCQNGADEENVCDAGLVDGSMAHLVIHVVGLGDIMNAPFPVSLGAPEATSADLGGLLLDLDVENESVEVTITNSPGGLGNVKVIATLSGLDWIVPNTQVIGASVSSDFDYVYAAAPEPFPAPGLASIVDGGHGVEIYIEELLWQSNEAHSVEVSFAASPGAADVPAVSAPGIAALVLVIAGIGIVLLQRESRDHA